MRTRFLDLRVPSGGNATAPAELVVDDGVIVAAIPATSSTCGADEQWVNLGGALVLPGAIDGHVHFDDPGFTHREDFSSGTTAAAAGGVTCVVDMPCTSLPPVTSVDALRSKLRVIAPKAHVDYMLWGGVSAQSMAEPGLAGAPRRPRRPRGGRGQGLHPVGHGHLRRARPPAAGAGPARGGQGRPAGGGPRRGRRRGAGARAGAEGRRRRRPPGLRRRAGRQRPR